jgi:FtsP/CotA-like multicopper oxidase with cupredoxin domain
MRTARGLEGDRGEAIRTVFGDGTDWLLRTFQPIHLANKQEDREGHQDEAKDVDREFVTLFTIFDENTSWYLEHNIQAYVSDPKGLNKLEFAPVDTKACFPLSARDSLRPISSWRSTVVSIGEGINFHTPHLRGNVVLDGGKSTDTIFISPAQMLTVDMVPDDPGIWMFHCHVDDNVGADMVALDEVEP